MHVPTLARYFQKSVRHPMRALRNGIEVMRFSMLDNEAELSKLFAFLEKQFFVDVRALQRELESSSLSEWSASRRAALENFTGPYRFGSTGVWDCEALYYLVRALRPAVVVETGVCYGASTSYILEALAHNGAGVLHSIDLGNTPDEPPNDFFVRPAHRHLWRLHVGDSKVLLPPLLRTLGEIDLFHHDSLHTYEHMMWEYETALPYISERGAISSDDVNIVLKLTQPFHRGPFGDFCEKRGFLWKTARNFGVAVDGSAAAAEQRRQHGLDHEPMSSAIRVKHHA
jgi:methyltransferase family protein